MIRLSHLLLIAILLSACGKGNKKQTSHNTEVIAPEIKTNNAIEQTTIYLNNAENVSIGDILIGSDVIINLGDIHLYRKIGHSGKAKYMDKQGNTLAKINVYDDAIKLKKEDGELLYKVKIYADKIKVAADNEMTNPFEIKRKNSQLFNIYKQGNKTGSVTFNNNIATITYNDDKPIYAIGLSTNKIAGVLALNEIEITYRCIIVTELLLK